MVDLAVESKKEMLTGAGELHIKPHEMQEAKKTQPPPELDITPFVEKAGTLILSEKQKEILYAPVNDSLVQIRPDGLIYLPWMEYVTRLKQTFDMEWTMIPHKMPHVKGDYVMWGFYLVIRGTFCGFSIGECKLTSAMTYGDAIEGAKSNALTRLCKGIGITIELWQPAFINRWKSVFAETYQDKGKTKWRKKVLEPVPKVSVEPKEEELTLKEEIPLVPTPVEQTLILYNQLLPNDKAKFVDNLEKMGKVELRKVYLAMQAILADYPQYEGE